MRDQHENSKRPDNMGNVIQVSNRLAPENFPCKRTEKTEEFTAKKLRKTFKIRESSVVIADLK